MESTVVLPQDRDTYLQKREVGPFLVRYASVRSSDSKEAGQNGQDYVSFRLLEYGIAFCVCDGVSQSYYGELASRYLGERLLDWLCKKMPYSMDETALLSQLEQFINDLSHLATRELQEHPVPDDIPGLLAEVLEEKRKRGSETTFACGLVAPPDEWFSSGRAVLAWLGNCRLRYGKGRAWGCHLLEDPDENKGRWSTKKGLVSGELRLKTFTVAHGAEDGVRRILAYTDGLALLDRVEDLPSDDQLGRLIEQAVESNYSDDCSLLEIELPDIGGQDHGRY